MRNVDISNHFFIRIFRSVLRNICFRRDSTEDIENECAGMSAKEMNACYFYNLVS